MTSIVPPRIYCVTAAEAPIVAVFRRGPTQWSHVGQWDLARLHYEPGAWLGGRIFPRRCDLSPDGRYLAYFAHKPSATWELGEAYVAVSKLPWLTALHAFATCGTWTRGYFFSKDAAASHSEALNLPIPYRLQSIPAVQFATERRRGWQESPDCPPRDPRDAWDERRNVRMQRQQPGGHRLLYVESTGHAGAEFGIEQAVDGLRVQYSIETDGQLAPLADVQWADWDQQGRLLVATRSGKLEVRNVNSGKTQVLFEKDLALLAPQPAPAPDWAQHW
jgi:hypothetical protein